MKINGLPKREDLFEPVIAALKKLGGSGSVSEINEEVIRILNLPEKVVSIPRKSNSNRTYAETALEYELAWTRTILKNRNVLESSSRGIWALKDYSEDSKTIAVEVTTKTETPNPTSNPDEEYEWKSEVAKILTEEISPTEFERLIQRILRETGFEQVEVTGRTGDGGIDGRGIAKINGILSFHILFQCKRYKGTVGAKEIRDFRGAMVGRTDKGLFVTTGKFTRDAIKEATRDGAPAIDLVDGEKLAEKLKELSLGVKTVLVEKVVVDSDWFRSL
ncbi:MAG: restriction endonuclease [Pyrinomonadaceae bacterium]